MIVDTAPIADRATTEELADIILVLQRSCMLNLSRELTLGKVSFPQYFLLGYLDANPPATMTTIAERMEHTTAAATGMIDRLEKLGYVERQHAATDRRKVLVAITPKGKALVARIRQDIIENLTKLMEMLSGEERRMWLQIYRKIHAFCSSKDEES